jgi:transposase-like protein
LPRSPATIWRLGRQLDGALRRAVDQHGTVLDILVQSRRNAKAARRFFKKLLKGLRYVPRVIVTELLWLQSKAA